MKKVIVAIDSFKGSLSSFEAGKCVRDGLMRAMVNSEIEVISIADGGEGSLDSILNNFADAKVFSKEVKAPDGLLINSKILVIDDTAVIEMAEASGLTLISPNKYTSINATSYGTGELMVFAAELGVKKIILFIGGSATTDGGLGAANAMGLKFYDSDHHEIKTPDKMINITSVDKSKINRLFGNIEITVACDVDNPLYGLNGAAYIYAPQKGAGKEEVRLLDAGLRKLCEVIKRDTGFDNAEIPGMGAAGGILLSLTAYFNAKKRKGIDLILDMIRFDKKLDSADLVITGEGRLDNQSAYGKAVSGIGLRAKHKKIPVIAIVGSIGFPYTDIYNYGITTVFNIQNGPMTLDESLTNTKMLLTDCAERVGRLVREIGVINEEGSF